MKKIMHSIALMLIITGLTIPSLYAGKVSLSKIETVATNFYRERSNQYFNLSPTELKITEAIPVYYDGKLVYYAVNFEHGFILISAWEDVFPVLGYSFSGTYITTTEQKNFVAWTVQYARQILFAVESNAAPTDEITATWKKYSNQNFNIENKMKFRDIEPMLTSTWNQGRYYNQMCPPDPLGVGGHCVTGCVATAMGQLAYYFRHPETGTGEYSYYDSTYGTISANFGNTTYKWDEMANSLTETNLATAELIFHIGVSVDMVYGPNSSGMYNHKAAYSLRTYFKYSPETEYVYRDSTSMDWDSLLITHLDQKIPMYYAGWSNPNISGHAFIVDGYQGDDFYHFNWGWGGSYDGYFYTGELTPGGSNFNLAQELIINCFPDTANYTYPLFCGGDIILTSLNGTFDDGSGPCSNYEPNSNCSWLIDPQTEMDSVTNITLSFQRFDLGNGYDFLNIYDGSSENAPLIAELVGNELPAEITSSGNKLFLVFNSDNNSTAPGFFVSYSTERPEWCGGMTVLTEQTDEMSDGSYSFYYENSSLCMWQIIPPNAGFVTLNFTKFQTEETYDILKIYDPANNTLLAEISGMYDPTNLPGPVTSPSGKMFITFTTNGDTRADGWDAWYETDLVNITETSSTFDVEVYPNPASELINISVEGMKRSGFQIELYNYQGQAVLNPTTSNTNLFQIDVSSIPEGIYLLNIHNGKMARIFKIVINH